MKTLKCKNQRGVTIVELLIVMGILGLVMGAIYSLYSVHQRSAYTQDEVVEVQQNLRIGIDSITRDVRMAGFLVPYTPNTQLKMPPVQLASDASGSVQPDNVKSDEMTLNTASATATFARITPLNNATTFIVPSTSFPIPVDSRTTVDSFTEGDYVRIVRPQDRSEPQLSTDPSYPTHRLYKVTGKVLDPPQLKLEIDASDPDPTSISLNKGDMICKTSSPYTTIPNTIKYMLGTGATCPTGQLCLMRNVNGTEVVIAQNMAGLQFRYLLDDGTEVDTPIDRGTIRAVRVTLTGQTISTKALSGGQAKTRQIESVIQIRNR